MRIVRDGLSEGGRNSGLARLTGHLLAKDVDARLVAELAQLVNQRCRPPLEGREVDASDLEPLANADRQSPEDAGRHVDNYRAKLEDLDGPSPFTYADRRCELAQIAHDLLEISAGRARNDVPEEIGEAGGDEAIARERLRQLAPAFTAQAILAQLDEKDG